MSTPSHRTSRVLAVAATALFLLTPALGVARAADPDLSVVIDTPTEGANVTRGEAILLSGSVTEVDCALTGTEWDLGGFIWVMPPSNPSQLLISLPTTTLGPHEIIFTATGACGVTKSANVTVNIVNEKPTAVLSAPSTVLQGQNFTLDASGSFDFDTITGYTFTIDGVARPEQSEPTLELNFSTVGSKLVELSVKDSHNETSEVVNATINVVLGPLVRIDVAGPDTVESGVTVNFTATGYDEVGNELFVRDVPYQGSATLGPDQVCHTEDNVTGCKDITVLIGALHHITVTATLSTINIDRHSQISARGFDVNGNEHLGMEFTFSTTRGIIRPDGDFNSTIAGIANITATNGTVSGSVLVRVTPTLPTTITIDPEFAVANTSQSGVSGSINVKFIDGPAAGGAKAKIFFQDPLGATSQPIEVTVDGEGNANFTSEVQLIPGEYVVSVSSTFGPNYGAAVDKYLVYVLDPTVI